MSALGLKSGKAMLSAYPRKRTSSATTGMRVSPDQLGDRAGGSATPQVSPTAFAASMRLKFESSNSLKMTYNEGLPGKAWATGHPAHLLAERAELVVGAVEAVMISQFGTVFSWDPDFRDPNECLHDEIPSLVAAILWPEPMTNASVSPTTRATVVIASK